MKRADIPVRIALLRGINVVGRNMLAMSDLRALFESLGLTDVRSLLQSGNLVFRCERHQCDGLERLLHEVTAKRLGVSVEFFVRSPAEWDTIVARNPFPNEATRDPGHLLVIFHKESLKPDRVKALTAGIQGRERISAVGKHLYAVYPDGVGRSKLTTALIERHLGCCGTARNWNTIMKLHKLAHEPAVTP